MAATFASPAAGPRPPVRAAQRAAGRGPLGLDGLRLTRRGRAVVVALALLVSMPFWLMKGQPWKAQALIIGLSLAIMLAASLLAAI